MNRGIKKNIYTETTIIRKAPTNYSLEEEHLYKVAFLYNLPGAFYYKLSKVNIRRYFDFSRAGFLLRETYKNYPGETKKSRLIMRSLLFFFEITKEIKRGKYYWVTDVWSQNYFHWFTDAISKYYLLKEKEGVAPILIPKHFSNFSYITSSLNLLKIPHEFIDKKKTSVAELIYPEINGASANYFPGILSKIREDITLAVPPTNSATSHRIYISRKMTSKRKVKNEEDILPVLQKFGFEIIYPEKVEFEKQVQMIMNCRVLLAPHGAGLTSMLFMQKGQKIIEITRNGKGHNNCFFTMANELDHEYYYMVGEADDPDKPDTDIIADPAKLESLLKQILGS